MVFFIKNVVKNQTFNFSLISQRIIERRRWCGRRNNHKLIAAKVSMPKVVRFYNVVLPKVNVAIPPPNRVDHAVGPRGGAQRVRRHLERRAKHALQLAHPGHAVNRRLQPLPPWPRRASEHDLAACTPKLPSSSFCSPRRRRRRPS